jgi:hypothetical protein
MSNSGSGNRRKGGGGGGKGGGSQETVALAPDSIGGIVNAMPKKHQDLHRTSFLLFLQKVTVSGLRLAQHCTRLFERVKYIIALYLLP